MRGRNSVGSRIASLAFFVITFIALIILFNVYKENYFGDFSRAEYNRGISEFKRDSNVKLGSHNSYRIVSNKYNDAVYSKKVEVKPNTPYRVSCKIKTKDVVTEKEISNAGAGICIVDTTECSSTLIGTNDWTEVEFMFDSKARTEVEIGFRLGSYADNCKGTAWFTDLKLEMGAQERDSHWKMVCFIFDSIDVEIKKDGKPYQMQETMTNYDITRIKDNMSRAKDSFKLLSNYEMTMDYEIIEISEPIKSISYDEENGYYVSPSDVSLLIKDIVEQGEYDYIYAVVKFGDVINSAIDGKNNWIGLGGMNYQDKGFANIRIPNDEKSYVFTYNASINTFPEEAFVHEFLHTAENISNDNNFDFPLLHNYEQYGYKIEPRESLKKWYADYMTKNITTAHGIKVGIDKEVYSIKPVHKGAFTYSKEIKFDTDPSNPIEEIRAIFNTIFNAGKIINSRRGENNT